ncbi:MAG: class I SAM-dependent RNA methyltransferase [Eubacteriales bacterium]|nr:class I SAM-dependent RNA methyltransferase [Eubacteriales bacterium]
MNIIMTTLFGLESLVAEELRDLGYDPSQISVSDGQVVLDAGAGAALAVARLNLNLRTAERVLIQLATYEAKDFDTLFEQAKKLPWEDWIDRNYAFHVNGYSRKSALFGIPACQSLIKKAIVTRLASAYKLAPGSQIREDQNLGLIRIQFGIVKDNVTIMVDTSGDGLHKRGYRPLRHEAPLKETLAAALIRLSMFRANSPEALFDPFCGSGTIPIEAALIARNVAPGLKRTFAGERWSLIGTQAFAEARKEARDLIRPATDSGIYIFGSDIAPQAIAVAAENARMAGVGEMISWKTQDISQLRLDELKTWTNHEKLLIIGNPPYGERLLNLEAAQAIYRSTCDLLIPDGALAEGIRMTLITPDEEFEPIAGRPADKRRKLYNGMIRCMMYHYFKQTTAKGAR